MKKQLIVLAVLTLTAITNIMAQTAMDFNKTNCNGTNSHLFEDLDQGKAVVLFYFMPNCGSCPPPAKKVQAMLEKINTQYPGKVKGYAIPFNNTTKCNNVAAWVTTNNLSLFTPIDSGAAQLAYYGGFGMPSVVLVGGADHRVIYTSHDFSNNDTTIIRDSILNLFQSTGVSELPGFISDLQIYPNPANQSAEIKAETTQSSEWGIVLMDLTGKVIMDFKKENLVPGSNRRTINTSHLTSGNYLLNITIGDRSIPRTLTISR